MNQQKDKYLERLTVEFLATYWPEKHYTSGFFKIPMGYVQKEGDPRSLIPDLQVVSLLEQALDAIDTGSSVRLTTGWLNTKLLEVGSKKVTFMYLNNLWHKLRGKEGNERYAKLQEAKDKIKAEPRERKKRRSINQKLGVQKIKLSAQKRRLEALLEKAAELDANKKSLQAAQEAVRETYIYDVPENTPEEEIVFKPNEGPQYAFLAASEQEVLYGGAAGGGKSYALVADPMRYFDNPHFNGLILRRTNDELRELIRVSQLLYPKVFKGADWAESKKTWTFPSGAKMWFTFIEHENDVMRYQGQAFTWIGFDELTQHPTPFLWNYLRTRLRTTSESGLPLIMRATTNPGGPGHAWVKHMFIDPAPPNKSFVPKDENGEELRWKKGPKAGQPLFQRRFIPASLYDNPYLADDGAYEANLLAQPEHTRRQLLEGDWNIVAGAAFAEWSKHHVIEPFEIPAGWRRFRSCDFGYSSHSAVHWFAIEPQTDRLYVYRELYVSKHTASDLADKILELEEGENISYGVLDSSCWHVRGNTGPVIAEEMIQRGCRWRPSDRTNGARINGRNRMHSVLKINEYDGKPGIQFFDTCRQIITDLPLIPTDPKGTDDIDPDYTSDHAYDSVRYGIMTRPKGTDIFFSESYGKPVYDYTPADPIFGY